jgi:hypothetical protein
MNQLKPLTLVWYQRSGTEPKSPFKMGPERPLGIIIYHRSFLRFLWFSDRIMELRQNKPAYRTPHIVS